MQFKNKNIFAKNRKLIILVASLIFILGYCFQNIFAKETNKLAMYRITCHEDEWVQRVEGNKKKITASSVLKDNKFEYIPENIFDGKRETCWCPSGEGVGEFIIFQIPYSIKGVRITNGLAANKDLFMKNNRIKKMYVGIITDLYYPEKGMAEYDVCGPRNHETTDVTYKYYEIILKDTFSPQDIIFSVKDYRGKELNIWSIESIRRSKKIYLVLGIDSIYKGNKYNNTCLSEVELIK